jgi:malate dehydrogenase
MAYAGFRYVDCSSHWYPTNIVYSFAEKLLKAAKGEKGITEPSYVYLSGVAGGDAIAKTTGVDFFSVPIELGVRLFPIHTVSYC